MNDPNVDRIFRDLMSQLDPTAFDFELQLARALKLMAKYSRVYYQELRNERFTKEEAIDLTKAMLETIASNIRQAALEAYRINQQGPE